MSSLVEDNLFELGKPKGVTVSSVEPVRMALQTAALVLTGEHDNDTAVLFPHGGPEGVESAGERCLRSNVAALAAELVGRVDKGAVDVVGTRVMSRLRL